MKIDRIIYKRNYLINPTTMEHQHIGVEVLLDETDNIDEVYFKAKKKVEDWFEVGLMNEFPKVVKDDVPVVDVKVSDIFKDIVAAKTIEQLGELRKNLPVELMKPYMNKLKELTEQIK